MSDVTFEESKQIINNAVEHLITGQQFLSENNTTVKPTKIVSKAISLKSLEIDTALLMISTIVKFDNGAIPSYRVVQLLKQDDIGRHLINIMNNYNWSYHGFMTISDIQIKNLLYVKLYDLPKFNLCTGFIKDDDIDSFVVKMIKKQSLEEDW